MDAAEILARLNKSREFDVTFGAAQFTLRLPSDYEERRLALNADARNQGEAVARAWMHDMAVAALIGWSGVTVGDLLRTKDSTVLAFDATVVSPLLDSRPDLLNAITVGLRQFRDARKAKIEADLKNSASASSGS